MQKKNWELLDNRELALKDTGIEKRDEYKGEK